LIYYYQFITTIDHLMCCFIAACPSIGFDAYQFSQAIDLAIIHLAKTILFF